MIRSPRTVRRAVSNPLFGDHPKFTAEDMNKRPKPGPTVGPKVALAGSAVIATATLMTDSMGANSLAGSRVRSLAPTRLGLP